MSRGKVTLGLVVVLAWALGPAGAEAQEKQGASGKQEQQAKLPVCPVMGDPVDFSVKTMTAEGPVYFCCEGCIKKYTKNPEKYAKKVAVQRAALKKLPRVQVSCPLSGKPIDKKVFTEQGGAKVYFCCAGCKPKYEKDPGKYAGKLAGSYTYQTRCPVSGEEIDPASFVDLAGGQRVYLCCGGCESKLLKNPEKYAKKLAEQGINIDVEKVKAGKGKQAQGGGS